MTAPASHLVAALRDIAAAIDAGTSDDALSGFALERCTQYARLLQTIRANAKRALTQYERATQPHREEQTALDLN